MDISSKVREANIEVDVVAEGRSFNVVFRRDHADKPGLVFASAFLDCSLIYEEDEYQVTVPFGETSACYEAEKLVRARIEAGCLNEEEP